MSRDGELWSLLRNVLNQGMAIQMDNANGKYPSYEHLSARLDEAARERLGELEAIISDPASAYARQPHTSNPT